MTKLSLRNRSIGNEVMIGFRWQRQKPCATYGQHVRVRFQRELGGPRGLKRFFPDLRALISFDHLIVRILTTRGPADFEFHPKKKWIVCGTKALASFWAGEVKRKDSQAIQL
jgi:hypothetical protein